MSVLAVFLEYHLLKSIWKKGVTNTNSLRVTSLWNIRGNLFTKLFKTSSKIKGMGIGWWKDRMWWWMPIIMESD